MRSNSEKIGIETARNQTGEASENAVINVVSKIGNVSGKVGGVIGRRLKAEWQVTACYLSLGLQAKQWLAMWLICALLLPVFLAAPVSAAAMVLPNELSAEDVSMAITETNSFESGQSDSPQSLWEQTKTTLKLTTGSWFASPEKSNLYENNEVIESPDETDDKSKADAKNVKKDKNKAVNEAANSTETTSTDNSTDDSVEAEESDKDANTNSSTTDEETAEEADDETSTSEDSQNESSEENSLTTTLPAKTKTSAAPLFAQLPVNEQESLFYPQNNLGSPAGKTEKSAPNPPAADEIEERSGIGNFSFDIGFASIPGRGIDASVGTTYNSRLWNKSYATDQSGNPINRYTFNVDKNWLAPGFNLGFGSLEGTAFGPAYLIDPSGTRRQLIYNGSASGGNVTAYDANDGSFIRVFMDSTYNRQRAFARYPDGSTVYFDYTANSDGRRRANGLVDNNGNYVSIGYVQNDTVGRISFLVDSLGRYLKFYYDASQRLVAVTVPAFGGSGETETIRFYYENITLAPTFNGIVDAPTTPISVLKYVYYPGTKSGFKYDYRTAFGMIYKITRLEGMSVSPDKTYVTSEGQWAAATEYNYPASGTLSDVPKYMTRTDDWVGRSGGAAPVTQYSSVDNTTTETMTSTITSPNGTITTTVLNKKNNEAAWDNGLVKETSVSSSSQLMQKSVYTWDPNSSSSPRLSKVENTNEVGLTNALQYQQYDQYNNLTVMSFHDYAAAGTLGAELKRVETTYETGAGWINRRLIHLPKSVKVYQGATAVSRTDYEYDKNGLAGSSALTARYDMGGHLREYNPFLPPLQTCAEEDPGDPGRIRCITTASYDPASDYRGNVTKVTSWADATNASDPLAEVTTMNYDVGGNVVSATVNCCQLKQWVYDNTNNYAYPVQTVSGPNNEFSTYAAYDYNTGLVTSTRDENNQPTYYEYESDTLRQKKVIYPNGGYTLTEYSDKLMSNPADLVPGFVRQTTTLESNKTVQSYGYFDGRGAAIRSATQTPDGWSVSAVEYDSIGRAVKTYNPFYASTPNGAVTAGTKFTQVINFDVLNRAKQVQMQDGTSVYSYPNEAPVTFTDADSVQRTGTVSRVKDQADKERRQVVDALNRIIRVDEPTTGGLGSTTTPNQPTYYSYDGNANLSKVVQIDGGTRQERKFKYDSLSRLTHEKQVEAHPTLDINGGYGAIDPNKWTKVLKYDSFGRLTDGYDARGVRTQFTYDAVNRVKTLTFSDGTPQVTYTYDQARSGFYNNRALTRVETAQGTGARSDTPATATEFDYDLMGRVSKHRQIIGTQTYSLEYSYNLAGQLTSQKYPSGKIVTNNYDGNGRLSSIADSSRTYLSNLQYQANGGTLTSMTLGNGIQETFEYNDRLQIKKMAWAKDGNIVQRYDYSFGQINAQGTVDTSKNNGQLAQIESYNGGSVASPIKQFTQKFNYDTVGRLEKETETRGDNSAQVYQQKFSYDRFGNRYLKSAENPSNLNPLFPTPIEDGNIDKSTNRLASNTGTIYDDAGNVTQDGKFRNLKFFYDANGRMYKTSAVDNSNPAYSVYDASGQRVATQIFDVWKFFIYDAFGKMVAEYGGAPTGDEGGVKYVHQDIQGSTRAITTNSGAVKTRTDYAAFGEEIQSNIGQRTAQGYTTSDGLKQKYALTERDEATGLDNTWWRKLEQRAGRWTSPDPYNGSASIGDPQSFNRYSYVENQPTNFVDPSGLQMVEYTCYDINTTGNIGEAAFTLTSTRCFLRVLPGESGGEEFPSGGDVVGGNPGKTNNDPCAGKKGNLDHHGAGDVGIPHITDRHIQQTPKWKGKKSYYTFGILASSLIAKQTEVINLNQEAFEKGGAIPLSGGGIAYVYAPYSVTEIWTPLGPAKFETGAIGADKSRGFKYTNVRTVIVKPDCKTVETSYPGFPAGVDENDPRIVGSPHWWNAFNTRL